MAIIYSGKRWDISKGRKLWHRGTAEYLKAISAEILPNTAEDVNASEIDDQGRYSPRDQLDTPIQPAADKPPQ